MFMATDTTPTYIFNPEHDLALAYGTEGYTAPPRARILRRDLQLLPAWYCRGGETADILSQNVEEDTAWLDKMSALIDVGSLRPIALNRLQCRHSDRGGGTSTCAGGCSMPASMRATSRRGLLC